MGINESLKKLDEVLKERDDKHTEFIKNILVAASSLLAVIVALHKTVSETYVVRVSFAVSMVSLGIGILSGAATLYRYVDTSQKMYEGLRDAIIQQLKDKTESFKPVSGNPSILYKYTEVLCYLSLCIAVISLCIYAIALS